MRLRSAVTHRRTLQRPRTIGLSFTQEMVMIAAPARAEAGWRARQRSRAVKLDHDVGRPRQPPGRKPWWRLPDRPRVGATIRQVVDWNTVDIDWQGRGWDRGLRGIAFDGDVGLHRRQRRAVRLHARLPAARLVAQPVSASTATRSRSRSARLFLTSTGFDSILGFDLDRQEFHWAMHVETHQFRFKARVFDPRERRRAAACSTSCISTACTAPRAACT